MGMLLPSALLVWAQPGLWEGITEVEVRSDGPSGTTKVEVSLHISPRMKSWTGNTGERSRRGGARKKLPWNPQEEAALPSGSKASCSLQGPPKGTKCFVFLSGGKNASESKLADFSCSLNPCSLFIILPRLKQNSLPKTQAVFRSLSQARHGGTCR